MTVIELHSTPLGLEGHALAEMSARGRRLVDSGHLREGVAVFGELAVQAKIPDLLSGPLAELNVVRQVLGSAMTVRGWGRHRDTAALRSDVAWEIAMSLAYAMPTVSIGYAAYSGRVANEVGDPWRIFRARAYLGSTLVSNTPGLRRLSKRYHFHSRDMAGEQVSWHAVLDAWRACEAFSAGDLEDVIHYLERSMPALAAEPALWWEHLLGHVGLISLHYFRGESAALIASAQRAKTAAESRGSGFHSAFAQNMMAYGLALGGDTDAAMAQADFELVGFWPGHFTLVHCSAREMAIRIALLRGETEKARRLWVELQPLFDGSQLKYAPLMHLVNQELRLGWAIHLAPEELPDIATRFERLERTDASAFALWVRATIEREPVLAMEAAEDLEDAGAWAMSAGILTHFEETRADALDRLAELGIGDPDAYVQAFCPGHFRRGSATRGNFGRTTDPV